MLSGIYFSYVYLFTYIFIDLFVYLFIYLFMYLFIYLFNYLFLLSFFVYLFFSNIYCLVNDWKNFIYNFCILEGIMWCSLDGTSFQGGGGALRFIVIIDIWFSCGGAMGNLWRHVLEGGGTWHPPPPPHAWPRLSHQPASRLISKPKWTVRNRYKD